MELLKQNIVNKKNSGFVLLMVILCVLPFLLSAYRLEVVVMLLTNIILVVGFRLITTTGDFSFAHATLMGVGAYTTAMIGKDLGWPFLAILPMGALMAALVGLIISYPLLRMRGFYFFIGSMAAGEAIRLCWVKFTNPFGGPSGISHIPPASIFGIDLRGGIPFYFLVMVIMVICVLILYRIDKSRLGDSFKAIAAGEDLSKSVGINIYRYRMLAFVMGSFFAGIAGVLAAYRLATVDPHQYAVGVALVVLVWVVVGGRTTFAGPIIGVVVLSLIEESIRTTMQEWMPLFYGAILILTVLFLPGGLESIPKKLLPWFKKKFGGSTV
ncbi:branched-chain amino acid ABC transporter permease [Chloroflexota bacterium]